MANIGSVVLMLVYEPATVGLVPYPIDRVDDEGLVMQTALVALHRADQRAEELSQVNVTLGEAARDDASQLKQVLRRLIPDLCTCAARPAGVM